jgi:hypothetical protein
MSSTSVAAICCTRGLLAKAVTHVNCRETTALPCEESIVRSEFSESQCEAVFTAATGTFRVRAAGEVECRHGHKEHRRSRADITSPPPSSSASTTTLDLNLETGSSHLHCRCSLEFETKSLSLHRHTFSRASDEQHPYISKSRTGVETGENSSHERARQVCAISFASSSSQKGIFGTRSPRYRWRTTSITHLHGVLRPHEDNESAGPRKLSRARDAGA